MQMLALCCMSVLLVSLDYTIINVALPMIHRELGASLSQLSWPPAHPARAGLAPLQHRALRGVLGPFATRQPVRDNTVTTNTLSIRSGSSMLLDGMGASTASRTLRAGTAQG
jgi:hypothetical protein